MNKHTRLVDGGLLRFLRNRGVLRSNIAAFTFASLFFSLSPLRSNPSGGVVIHGDVNFSSSGSRLLINQSSANAIINWDDFSIKSGEITQFVQPGSGSAVLNRVTGGSQSEIQGALRANGNVFVINPNGILVGANGTIDVHGLVLSTLDVSDGDFLNGGDMVFRGGSGNGVTNLGKINGVGGDVFLIGRTVSNSGQISAPQGTVGLGAGTEVLLKAEGNSMGERMFIRAGGSGGGGTGVYNDGTIAGAAVELKAHGNAYALAINNKGSVRATGASNVGGRAYLRSEGGRVSSSGSIAVSGPSGGSARALIAAAYAKVDGELRAENGRVRVTGTELAEIGGTIDAGDEGGGGDVVVEGRQILVKAGSTIDASGTSGGGTVRIGGGFQGTEADVMNSTSTIVETGASLRADALSSGDGGTVVIWSDEETSFYGSVSARVHEGGGKGGFVEISGKESLTFDGLADASSVSGRRGTVLFDPGTVTIGGTGSTMTIASINSTLDTNTNVTIATHSGDVIFENVGTSDFRDVSVQWNTDASLGVFASGDVRFLNHARTAGAGSVSVLAGWTGDETDPQILANDPESAWDFYVQNGQFGIDDNDPLTGVGNVYINDASNNRAVAVGSRYGNTNVAGNDVLVVASESVSGGYAHLGFADNGQVFYFNSAALTPLANAGDPLVALVGVNELTDQSGVYAFDSSGVRTDVTVPYADNFGSTVNGNWWWRSLDGLANGSSGRGDYLPGMGAGSATASADINVEARGKLEVTSGRLANSYDGPYAQVGHGGNARDWRNVNRNDDADDRVYSVNFGDGDRFSASIGRLAGVYSDINIRTGLDVNLDPTLAAGTVTLTAAQGDAISNLAGTQLNQYAQIGHMGLAQTGSVQGDIKVLAGGAVGVNAGNGWRNHAQIGHRVGDIHADKDPRLGVGEVAVTGQTPDGKLGGGQHAQLRIFNSLADLTDNTLREGDLAGHVIASTATGPNYTGVAGLYDGAASVTGAGDGVVSHLEGAIEVDSETGAVTVTAFEGRTQAGRTRDSQSSYAQIGHVGSSTGMERVSATGQINVTGTELFFRGGNQSDGYAFAQLGHGGANSKGDFAGDIFATATTGGIQFLGGVETIYDGGSAGNYAQLGHGGYDADGSHSGNITVSAGIDAAGGFGLNFVAGNHLYSSVQLGHGGYNARSTQSADPQGFTGSISIDTVGDIFFTGGNGIDGSASANHNLSAHLGHGGYDADAVNSNTNFLSDPDWGHSGAIAVISTAGDIVFSAGGTGGTDNNAGRLHWVQLGHGGYAAGGNHHGNITVEATKGDVLINAGGNSNDNDADRYNYAQLGHGGTNDQGNFGLAGETIKVTAGGEVGVRGGEGTHNFAMIGNGGYNSDGTHRGAIEIYANDTVAMDGSTIGGGVVISGGSVDVGTAPDEAYAMIGHGGYGSSGDHEGSITVNAGEAGLDFDAGTGSFTFAMLGHGSAYSNGDQSGVISVETSGAVNMLGGSGANSKAQIGHGGYRAIGDQSGAISVVSTGNGPVELSGGEGYFSSSIIGHGGREANGAKTGAVTVDAGTGSVALTGGTRNNYTSAQIGHGSPYLSHGDFSGAIDVSGGTITLDAGTGGVNQVYALIGHGGYNNDGDHSGAIHLTALTGDLTLKSGTGDRNFASIGHGGQEGQGTKSGDICVTVGGSILLDSTRASGGKSNTQIGHGGYNGDGVHSGDIVVTTGHDAAGGVVLKGGTSADDYAQIGHGGAYNSGSMGGNITVIAADGGGIELMGATTASGYAMIGHGDGAGATTTGTREGGVHLFADGSLTATSGTAAGNVNIYHQTGSAGGLATNYLGGDGFELIANGGITLPDSAVAELSAITEADQNGGRITFALSNDIDITLSEANSWNFAVGDAGADDDFYILTGGNLTMFGSYQTAGTGDVTLVAGWDGTGFTSTGSVSYPVADAGPPAVLDFCSPIISPDGTPDAVDFNCESVGNGDAILVVGSDSQVSRVSVGSAGGLNTFAGAGIELWAGDGATDAATQLGYFATGSAVSGAIDVKVKGRGLSLNSGDADGSFTQIGHGGTGADASGGVTADIVISFCDPSDILLDANTGGIGAYSQIGHGGVGLAGSFSGAVTVDGARNVTLAGGGDQSYVQIGHGGSSGTHGIDSAGDPTFAVTRSLSAGGAIQVMNTTGAISMTGGNGLENAYAQIGHGGVAISNGGSISGDISVEGEAGGISLNGGTGSTAYALIGNGGYQVASALDGTVRVDATGNAIGDGIEMNGGDGNHSYAVPRSGYSGAMIGNGGYLTTSTVGGDTYVTVQNGGLQMNSGEGYLSNTTIGHSLHGSGAAGSGVVDVDVVGGDIYLEAGSTEWFAFSQIGHGGWDRRNHDGAIHVTATAGDITVKGADGGVYSWAKIGHGGYGNNSVQINTGEITVEATAGSIELDSRGGKFAFTQIGHGGLGKGSHMSGEYHDDITVSAGEEVKLGSGEGEDAFSMIGHGGTNARGTFTGNVDVNAGAEGVFLTGGTGSRAFSQIGHGGYNQVGATALYDISDAIVTVDAGKLALQGGGNSHTFAMVGHGGSYINGVSANGSATVPSIAVTTTGTGATDGVSLNAGSGDTAFAMIGSGGRGGMFDASGDISVTSAGGGVSLEGSGTSAFALIGNGGHELAGTLAGDTSVTSNGGTATDGILMKGGTGTFSYANIGNATNNITGSILDSDTFVTVAGGGLRMEGGLGTLSQAAIGLQSRFFIGDRSGLVDVDVNGGDVVMTAGDGTAAHVQIGHGGYGAGGGASGAMLGDVDLYVGDGSLTMSGGDGGYSSYAMIGSGGSSAHTGTIEGSVIADVEGAITMNAGGGVDSFAMIGLGGNAHTGNTGTAGDEVRVASRSAGIEMTNGDGEGAFVMIGLGGQVSQGNKTGNILVSTADGVVMDGTGGAGTRAFLQIGSGGYDSDGSTINSSVSVTGSDTDSAIRLLGGAESYQYALIGNGGGGTAGSKSGAVTVEAGSGGIALRGGGDGTPDGSNSLNSFVQIGHGGSGSSGAADGAINVTTTNSGDVILHGGGKRYSHAQIGHGGRSSAVSGLQSGTVSVTADGKVELRGAVDAETGITSDQANETFAQIGHGGMFANTTFAGDISVSAKTGVLVESGGSHYSRAQIGHGGYRAGTDAGTTVEMVDADVTVTTEAGGVILDSTKADDWAYSMALIGNGGTGNYNGGLSGAFRGDITVEGGTGNIKLHSGNRAGSSAMIGNGGTGLSGDHSGMIHVSAEGDLIMDIRTSVRDNSFSRIGHGGVGSGTSGADHPMSGNMSGDICVHVGGKAVLDATGGIHEGNYVQIGHGGSRVIGDFTGNITVVARGADGIALTAGSGTGAYSHIGHGGRNTAGTMNGHIDVVAETGDIELTGGGTDSYAMLGHGDGSKTSTGQRGGGMHIFASGDLTGTGGSGAANEGNVYFFHQNNTGLQPADYIAGSGNGYQKVVNGTTTLPAYSSIHETTMINGNLGTGLIQIRDDSETDYEIDAASVGISSINSSDDFYLVTGGNITFLTSFQNSGSGDVTLVAGWDGTGVEEPGNVSYPSDGFGGLSFCSPVIKSGGLVVDFNECSSFGNNGKTITVGSAGQTERVSIGSAGGTNAFAAAGITLYGGSGDNAATQLGFYGDGTDMRGEIIVRAKELGLTMHSGSGENAFTQIGHGGGGSTEGGAITADITVSFCEPGGFVDLQAGGTSAYSQIGHGGYQWDGQKLGAILVENATDVTLQGGGTNANAQIGHGGRYSGGEMGGTVTVEASGDILGTGGTGSYSYVQIGHGVTTNGTQDISLAEGSDVSVTAGRDIIFRAGTTSYTQAKIGHGGNRIDFVSFGESDISVEAGRNIGLYSPDLASYAARSYSHSQIGHGGAYASVGNQTTDGYSGNITVDAGGKLDVVASRNAATFNYSLIGHTSYYNIGGTHSGEIQVTTGTEAGLDATGYGITLQAGYGDYNGVAGTNNGYYNFAAIGHRGHNRSTGLSGNIDVTVERGGLSINGGTGIEGSIADPDNADIRLNPAQIGHGGYNITSTGVEGDILVDVQGDILLRSDNGRLSPVQIGHGGYSVDGTIGSADDTLVVISREGALELNASGSHANNTTFIGNGSSTSGTGARLGDILIDVEGEISLVEGDAPVWIGHRSNSVANFSDADVTVRARAMDGVAGDSGGEDFRLVGSAGTMMGHNLYGGHVSLVNLGGGSLWLDGTSSVGDSAFDFNLLSTGDIHAANSAINRGSGDVNLVAGWDPAAEDLSSSVETAPFRYYWIRDIDMDSQIFSNAGAFANGGAGVWIGANADLTAADRAVAIGSRAGQSNVAGQDIHVWGSALTGGVNSGSQKHSQIGYNASLGGSTSSSPVTGRVRVKAVNDVEVEANHFAVGSEGYAGWTDRDQTGYASYAQIGHGGERAAVTNMDLTGEIIVEAGNDVSAKGGLTRENHALIGHGGYDNRGGTTTRLGGDISVDAGNEVLVEGGEGIYSFGQIGHAGVRNPVAVFEESAISVTADGDVVLRGGDGIGSGGSGAYAMIGHGGYTSELQNPGSGFAGSVEVQSGGTVLLTSASESGSYNFSQIGHGGYGTTGNHSGDIHVTGVTEVLLDVTGADGTANFAMIGHGGYLSGGDHADDIAVVGGVVELEAGSGADSFVQIGHGGVGATGDLSGATHVLSGGDLLVAGGIGDADGYAMIGQGDGTVAGSGGNRSGEVKIVAAGKTSLSDNSSAARLGHMTTDTGAVTDSEFVLVTGTLDTADSAVGVTGTADIMGEGGDVTFAVLDGDLVAGGSGAFIKSDFDLSFVSSGNVTFLASAQNSGSGNVGAAAGWDSQLGLDALTGEFDGSNGLLLETDFNLSSPLQTLEFDFAPVAAADALWGNGAAILQVGDGSQVAPAVFGSASGTTIALGHAVEINGGDAVAGSEAQIGFNEERQFQATGENNVDADGAITVMTKEGGLLLEGGDGARSEARIGHGGAASQSATLSGSVEIDVSRGLTPGDLTLSGGMGVNSGAAIGHGGEGSLGDKSGDIILEVAAASLAGGDGLGAFAQIGHGGTNSDGTIDGTVSLTTEGDLTMTSGSNTLSWVQIGHGGAGADGDITGSTIVTTGGSIEMVSSGAAAAYTKIGQGDDMGAGLENLSGTGDRSGDINISSSQDITLVDAMIGHLNSINPNATSSGGSTQIAVGTSAPTDPAAGTLTADAASEFHGQDELRFYMARRGNNRIAAGAGMNGISFAGAQPDPSESQRNDEFTINILGDDILFPNQHANVFGTGPAPANAGNFAFYYDTIVLEEVVLDDVPADRDTVPVILPFIGLLELLFPDDRTSEEWRRDLEEEYTRYHSWGIYYEGFGQYDLFGNSTFDTGM